MRSLWRFLSTLAILSLLLPLPALAQGTATLIVATPNQPQSGAAFSGATVSLVAVSLTAGSAPVTVTGLKVQRVGSAPDSVISKLQVNDSATSILASVTASFDSTHTASIPLSVSLSAGQSKTLLVSAVMGSNITANAGQSLQLNVTGIVTSATLQGALPVFGSQSIISTNIPKPTCSLSANTNVYQIGDTVNITWHSTNATGGTISGLGSVGPQGLQGILPRGNSETLVGTFTGPAGSGTCSITLTLISQGGTGVGGVGGGGGVDGSGGVENPGTVSPPGSNGGGSATTGGGNPIGTVTPPTGTAPPSGSGLVPCGNSSDPAVATQCRPCDLPSLAQNVINVAIGLSIPAAAAMFAWAGILYFTSAANPANIEKARRLFKSVFWGFLIIISAWIVIQTLLKFVLAPEYYNNWNSIVCTSNNRPGANGNYTLGGLEGVLQRALGGLYTGSVTPVQTGGIGGGGIASQNPFDTAFGNFTGSCGGSGYELVYDYGGSPTCWNSTTDTYKDPTYANNGSGDILAAAQAYIGSNTSGGPEDGNKACAWAINNILQAAGYAPIDGDSVALMEQNLRGGRGAVTGLS